MNRFWSKVNKSGPDECWEWQATSNQKGYGRFWIAGKLHPAHRVAWELAGNTTTPGTIMCHRCDNPGCCNPAHLFEGSVQDNTDDMMKKGRHVPCPGERNGMRKHPSKRPRGLTHGRRKRTPELEASMRSMREFSDLTFKQIGQIYGTTKTLARAACQGAPWDQR